MSKAKDIVAIACADLHLCANAPLARAGEPSWYAAMEGPLIELTELSIAHEAPIFCAGDVFDKWGSTPELINWAIQKLPFMYAIPGQHDLPLHDLKAVNRSAFQTLVLAKKIKVPPTNGEEIANGVSVYGFPWGVPIQLPDKNALQRHKMLHIALIHAYTWMPGSSYKDAPEEARLPAKNPYKGFGTVIIGDNHLWWNAKYPSTYVFNCGGFMRRRADEKHQKPRVGLIHRNGEVETHYLYTKNEVMADILPEQEYEMAGLEDFIRSIGDLGGKSLDFRKSLTEAMAKNKTNPAVVRYVLEALDGTA